MPVYLPPGGNVEIGTEYTTGRQVIQGIATGDIDEIGQRRVMPNQNDDLVTVIQFPEDTQ
jgi:hypothetical protein